MLEAHAHLEFVDEVGFDGAGRSSVGENPHLLDPVDEESDGWSGAETPYGELPDQEAVAVLSPGEVPPYDSEAT